jgi:hypothetical protein
VNDSASKVKRLHLPRFREDLQQHVDQFKNGKSDATYCRYREGVLPANLVRLMRRPELLEALAADAREHPPTP